ncbi:hypothetical protein NL473_27545, partial [Klebsiella pneumoniae]|nr:hypothetical protein [Klebsiella pneumoniae]MCP6594390.1 hypothetical protein [Klebsiella pneumoniae]
QGKLNEANQGLDQVNNGLGEMQSQVEPLTEQQRVQQMLQQSSQLPPQQAVQQVTGQSGQLAQGLEQSQNGISQVQDGQTQIQQRLKEMADDKNIDKSGMHITDDMLKNTDLKDSVKH